MASISAYKRISATLVAALAASAFVSACSSGSDPYLAAYDDDLYAAAVCVDSRSNLRVPDTYCPIGDGIMNGPFTWAYSEYRWDSPDIDVVYVGYPVDRTRYVFTRPLRVSTIHIDRGRYPERPPAGVSAASARVAPAPAAVVRQDVSRETSGIQRGGLGVPSQNGATGSQTRVTAASGPRGATAAPLPTRANTAPAVPKPAAVPPAPASRPQAPAPAPRPAVKVGK